MRQAHLSWGRCGLGPILGCRSGADLSSTLGGPGVDAIWGLGLEPFFPRFGANRARVVDVVATVAVVVIQRGGGAGASAGGAPSLRPPSPQPLSKSFCESMAGNCGNGSSRKLGGIGAGGPPAGGVRALGGGAHPAGCGASRARARCFDGQPQTSASQRAIHSTRQRTKKSTNHSTNQPNDQPPPHPIHLRTHAHPVTPTEQTDRSASSLGRREFAPPRPMESPPPMGSAPPWPMGGRCQLCSPQIMQPPQPIGSPPPL